MTLLDTTSLTTNARDAAGAASHMTDTVVDTVVDAATGVIGGAMTALNDVIDQRRPHRRLMSPALILLLVAAVVGLAWARRARSRRDLSDDNRRGYGMGGHPDAESTSKVHA